MSTFYICRHGQTEYNAEFKMQGWFDTPLTTKGVENAHRAAGKVKSLGIDIIYSSDLGRAFITAYIISRELNYRNEIIISKDLREVEYGDLSGLPESEVLDIYHHLNNADTYIPPHGESLEHMQARVLVYINRLSVESPSKVRLLVTHDCVINAIYAAYANLDFGEYNTDHTNPHGFVAKIEVEENKIKSFEVVK
jgi:broad specificity phosphatase PhoE